ncbi:MAG: hypothetical protein IPK22_17840 [Verrucomicrobiaceae bacterium]|nr:hypothetical protein [Verrucomicrobiaceae bacterium]
MNQANAKLSSFRRWMVVLVIAVLAAWFVVSTNIKNQIFHPRWFNTQGALGFLNENLTPEIIASHLGKAASRDEKVLLRTDWKMAEGFDTSMSLATPNKDAWGSLFYLVCDFNNDGLIPNPETLTTPPNLGAVPKLKQRLAIFSAGPDGDPATWEDNVPPSFE